MTFCAGYSSLSTLRVLLANGGTLAASDALHEAAANQSESSLEMMRSVAEENGTDVNQMSTYRPRRAENG